MATILALDIATCTGWAVGPVIAGPTSPLMLHTHEEAARVYCGHNDLRGSGLGDPAVFNAHFEFIRELLTVQQPDHLFLEAPFVGGNRPQVAARLFGLVAVTELAAHRHGIYPSRTVRVHIGQIKKHWTGHGMSSKQNMIDAAKARGYQPETDDEADAIALLDYAMCQVEPARKRRSVGVGRKV